ncbi:MAG: thermonuclease family protein [Microthrixaceae bacterium]|nr:thermonuclease family protein [Microthrixaceae bacterium]
MINPTRIFRRVLLVAIGALLAGCAETPSRPAGAATVLRVVDGDTVVVNIGGSEENVRLIGVDTPETVDPRRPVGCFGKEAGAHTKSLLPEGTEVRLERDVEQRDRYGRLLAYLYRSRDGLFVNDALLRDGYGQLLTIPPNIAHVERFTASQRAARESGSGLWSACTHE